MIKKDSLGDRMKCYEAVPKNFLMRRQPVIIRLDMKAGHSFTRGFDKPFDDIFIETMQRTMLYLCKNIQGCVLGYSQSDEITLILCDYQKIDTDAWFGYNVEKIVSISASLTTLAFNREFNNLVADYCTNERNVMRRNAYYKSQTTGALFDSRAFNVPINEMNNCLIWRQQDAIRNSIQSLAQSLYSHKEIESINYSQLQDKMFTEKGINWNDLSTTKKRGSCCIKVIEQNPNVDIKDGYVPKKTWTIDNNIPIFSQDRNYVNSRIVFEEED